MRKVQKESILEIITTLEDAHKLIKQYLDTAELNVATGLLAECQNTAISLADIIEKSEGEECITIKVIEDYCNLLYSEAQTQWDNKEIDKTLNDKLFESEAKIIKDLAKKSCIIVGRCADYVLRNEKNIIKVFLYSDEESKIKRATKYYGLSNDKAQKEITKINKQRAKHYNYYTSKVWNDYSNYDYVINVDKLGVEKTSAILKEIVITEDSLI